MTTMKKYNITVNGTTYEVIVEEADGAVSAPVYQAPVYQAPAAPVAAPAAPKAAAPVVAPAAPSAPAGAPSIPHFGSSVAEVKEEPVAAEAPKANDNGFEDDQFYIMINDIIKGKDNQ